MSHFVLTISVTDVFCSKQYVYLKELQYFLSSIYEELNLLSLSTSGTNVFSVCVQPEEQMCFPSLPKSGSNLGYAINAHLPEINVFSCANNNDYITLNLPVSIYTKAR
jgi:hypothetical protein